MMARSRYWRVLAAVTAITVCAAGRAVAADEGSFEHWAQADFRIPINELWYFTFNEQRLYGGFYVPLHKQVRLELYYFWKLNKQDDNSWQDTNVLGSFLHFQF